MVPSDLDTDNIRLGIGESYYLLFIDYDLNKIASICYTVFLLASDFRTFADFIIYIWTTGDCHMMGQTQFGCVKHYSAIE